MDIVKRVRESVGKSTGPCALLNQNGDHVNNEIVQFMKKCSPNETNIVALEDNVTCYAAQHCPFYGFV